MTPADIKRFHQDLKAAILAKVPLEISIGNSRPDLLTAARVDNLHAQLESELTDLETKTSSDTQSANLQDVFSSIPKLPRRYQAALQTFERIGSMSPVLDSLSMRSVSNRQVSRVLRWTWFYLGLLILVAYSGLWLFSSTVEPVIAAFRADAHIVASQNKLTQADFLPAWPIALPAVGCGLAILFGWALLGGTRKMSAWMGGTNYTRIRLMTAALNTTQLLVAADTPLDQAVSISCDLAGVESKSRLEIQSFGTTRIADAAARTDHLLILANRCLLKLKYRTPIMVVSIVGGLVSVVYGVLVFRPITNMLSEIGKTAI